MLQYIRAIKINLRDQYKFVPSKVDCGEPCFEHIPDGDYPMKIDGKLDNVKIIKGAINCCNFD